MRRLICVDFDFNDFSGLRGFEERDRTTAEWDWQPDEWQGQTSLKHANRGVHPMIVRTIAGGVEVLAPAKLNLFLEVLARRPDGYHEIESLMVTVDLHDTLTVTELDSGCDRSGVRRPELADREREPGGQGRRASQGRHGLCSWCPDRPHEGDSRAGGAGGRVERRGGDPGGSRSDLGPGDARQPARCGGGRDRQRRALLPARTRGGLSRTG